MFVPLVVFDVALIRKDLADRSVEEQQSYDPEKRTCQQKLYSFISYEKL